MSQRLKVLFIVSSLKVGGMEKFTVELLNSLPRDHFQLSFATLRNDSDLLPQLDTDNLSHRLELDARGRLDLKAVGRLHRWFGDHPQDVVVCINEYPMLYVRLALMGRTNRPAMVESFHTNEYQTRKERLQLLLYRPMFASMDLLIYVSERQRERWHRLRVRGRRELVIHNGVAPEKFRDDYTAEQKAAIRAEAGFGADDFVVVICAALRPEKAHADLLHAIAALHRRGIPAKALIVGDGPERAAIERVIDNLQLRGHAHITGMRADVRPYLAAADVFALVSLTEAFSVAVVEAMCMGKPVVLSRVGGADEQVDSGITGYLFEAGDVAGLTDRLARLHDAEHRLSLGRNAATTAAKRFSKSNMVVAYTHALQSVGKAAGIPCAG